MIEMMAGRIVSTELIGREQQLELIDRALEDEVDEYFEAGAVVRPGDVVLDPAKHNVTRGSEPVELTRKEFGVLEELMRADGAVVSAEQLLEKVWDENADPFTNVVRVTVMTLRRKLGDPPLIHTVVTVGYRLGSTR